MFGELAVDVAVDDVFTLRGMDVQSSCALRHHGQCRAGRQPSKNTLSLSWYVMVKYDLLLEFRVLLEFRLFLDFRL